MHTVVNKFRRSLSLKIFVAVFIILGLQTVFGMIVWQKFGPENMGTFGDMFGGLNVAFSGLAFYAIVYSLVLQRAELELQRNELELARKELSKAAEANLEQAKHMKKAAQIDAISSSASIYTQLSLYKNDAGNRIFGKYDNERTAALYRLDKILNETESHAEKEGA